jgi:hypothetical protein
MAYQLILTAVALATALIMLSRALPTDTLILLACFALLIAY